MAKTHEILQASTFEEASTRKARPFGGRHLDWLVALLGCWTVGGIFLDGWAHNHGKVDSSFFTLWHALLYSRQTRFLANPTVSYGQPVYSPDGQEIPFSVNMNPDSPSSTSDIYVANLDGSNLTRLTSQRDNGYPIWSPNGKKIAFFSLRDGNAELYVMDTDGKNQTRLTNNPAWDGVPTWSPDSTELAFQSDRDGVYNIYLIIACFQPGRRIATACFILMS
jgi:hypothetical protein